MTSPGSTAESWMTNYGPDDPALHKKMSGRRLALFLAAGFGTLLFIALERLAEERISLLETASLRPVLEEAPSWLAAATFAAGLLLFGGAFVFGLMPAQRRATNRNPWQVFTSEQRTEVKQRIRGRFPVTAGEVPLLRRAAEGLYAARWAAVAAPGVSLLVIWTAMTRVHLSVSTLFVIPALFLAAVVLRDARAAKAFLRATGSTE